MKKAITILLFYSFLLLGCENQIETKGELVSLTELDTLQFLVKNSDIIVLATLSGSTDKPRPSFFFGTPKSVQANIDTIIKGEENLDVINLTSHPKYLDKYVIQSTVILRNGYHLIFACKSEKIYQPTTSNSLYDVLYGNIYPIWRPDQYTEIGPDGMKGSRGIPLEEVINEIKNEIKLSS
jgi:hypothetical protein